MIIKEEGKIPYSFVLINLEKKIEKDVQRSSQQNNSNKDMKDANKNKLIKK